MTTSWRSLLAEAAERVGPVAAQRIVEEASGLEGPELAPALDSPASRRGVAALDEMVRRRETGEPLQYVLGRWGFRTLDLMVDRRALIPRPETEVVVSHVLDAVDRATGEDDGPVQVVDLGTGSGAIALAVAAERPEAVVTATDRSGDALAVAAANLAGLGRPGRRVTLTQGSWFDALDPDLASRVDVLVSNPPYVAATETLPPEVVDWEPVEALVAGPTGLEAIEALLVPAGRWLARRGRVVVEIAPHQAADAVALAGAAGLIDAHVEPDLTGRERVLVADAAP